MSFKLKNTEIFLTNYANKLIALAKKDINEPRQRTYNSIKFGSRTINEPLNSSGDLADSLILKKKLLKGGSFFQFNIDGNAYGEKVDEGTKKGTSPSVSELVSWINAKPVKLTDAKGNNLKDTAETKNRIANQIAQKINREGIKPTNFLTDLINQQLNNILGVAPEIIKDINMDVDGFMQKLGYIKSGNTFKLTK
jgi:hypothetical protein